MSWCVCFLDVAMWDGHILILEPFLASITYCNMFIYRPDDTSFSLVATNHTVGCLPAAGGQAFYMQQPTVNCFTASADVRGCRSSHIALFPDTTSPRSCHTAPYEEPPAPNTAEREAQPKVEESNCRTEAWTKNPPGLNHSPLTSGVPQKVEVVPSGSTPSLHRPKSVSTTWPWRHQTQTRTV